MQDGRSNPELYDSDGKGLVAALALGPIRVIKNKYALNLQKTLDSVTGSFQEKFENLGSRG